jgi:hypothetical protein
MRNANHNNKRWHHHYHDSQSVCYLLHHDNYLNNDNR